MRGDVYCEFNQHPAHNPPMSEYGVSDGAGISLAYRENAGTQRPTEQSAEPTAEQGCRARSRLPKRLPCSAYLSSLRSP